MKDVNGDGATGIEDVKLFLEQNPHTRTSLAGGGDFRSAECVELLKQADIVATNPPFSLFKEYVAQLVAHSKKFLIIANKNAITYLEIFPLIKDNKLWMGVTPMGADMLFNLPPKVAKVMIESGKKGSNYRIVNGKVMGRSTSVWFTNLDHGRRHQRLECMTMAENLKFSKNLRGKSAYDRYDNYDAIEVGTYKEIPSDYDGAMGVPITFLDKYNPDQFEIIGNGQTMADELGIKPVGQKFVDDYYSQGNKGQINAKWNNLVYRIGMTVYIPYQRILIKRRQMA